MVHLGRMEGDGVIIHIERILMELVVIFMVILHYQPYILGLEEVEDMAQEEVMVVVLYVYHVRIK